MSPQLAKAVDRLEGKEGKRVVAKDSYLFLKIIFSNIDRVASTVKIDGFEMIRRFSNKQALVSEYSTIQEDKQRHFLFPVQSQDRSEEGSDLSSTC